jgi:hypothetical protein
MKFYARSLSGFACAIALAAAPTIAEARTNHFSPIPEVLPLSQLIRQQPSDLRDQMRLAKGHGGEEDLDYRKRHKHNLNGRAG